VGSSAQIAIEGVVQYLEQVAKLPLGTDDFFVYRGESKTSWKCVPGIGRTPYGPNAIYMKPDQLPRPAEYRLFVRFRDMTVAHQPAWVNVPSGVEHAWRQLVLAQHYRLPTRLLDWSTKPLVGLYFAVEEEARHKNDGAIHVYSANMKRAFTVSALAEKNEHPPLYDFDSAVGLLWPPDIDSRVTGQGSIFTISTKPRDPVSRTPKFIVPADHKKRILRELRLLGITRSHLFPDMENIARSLKEESAEWDQDIR